MASFADVRAPMAVLGGAVLFRHTVRRFSHELAPLIGPDGLTSSSVTS